FAAPTVTGRDGNISESAYNDEVLGLIGAVVPLRDGSTLASSGQATGSTDGPGPGSGDEA
ncbi:MAG: hypothetical protein J2P22_09725, partial [Nocardioides sp.]|nr:hypothetical protein [Nocardioides sp.]